MRRLIIIGTALAVLACAGAAFAATQVNRYTASFAFPAKAGSTRSPKEISFGLSLGAANRTKGSRAAPLTDIKTSIYGLVDNQKGFPTCSASKIMSNRRFDKACPKGSLVASGTVQSEIGSSNLSAKGEPCHLVLNVYNGGNNTLVYFFETSPLAGAGFNCGGLHTGAAKPYFGHLSRVGNTLVQNVVLPPDVSTMAGGLPNVYGSLTAEHLTWFSYSHKVHGKTVYSQASVGCKAGKRPWTVTFSAVNGGAKLPSVTVRGSARC